MAKKKAIKGKVPKRKPQDATMRNIRSKVTRQEFERETKRIWDELRKIWAILESASLSY